MMWGLMSSDIASREEPDGAFQQAHRPGQTGTLDLLLVLTGLRDARSGDDLSVDRRTVLPSIVQELCESRGGRPGLSVLTSLLVSVDVKNY